MRFEVTVENMRKDPKKMGHIIRCIAAWIAQTYPGLNAQEHTEKTFLAVVRLHLGLDIATASGEGMNQVMFIKPSGKPKPGENYIVNVVDKQFTTDIRALIGIAAALARKDKNDGERRSTN